MAEHDDIRARLAVYKADMEYLTKEGRVDEINVTNTRYISDIKTLWKRIHELEVEREKISALFPDDATHKHAQTGESLYDNIQDALRDLAKAKADLAAAREDVAQLEKWLNEDPEMRLAEVLVGESYRWCVRLEQLVFDEPGSVKFSAEAGTFSEALHAAIDSARAGGGKEPIRASGDCICSMCGKRYGDHPMDKEVLSGIDNLPFLHVLCDGARVKL